MIRLVKHSPHKRWKGHDIACAMHKIKGAGAMAYPFRVMRQLGQRRRIKRPRPNDE